MLQRLFWLVVTFTLSALGGFIGSTVNFERHEGPNFNRLVESKYGVVVPDGGSPVAMLSFLNVSSPYAREMYVDFTNDVVSPFFWELIVTVTDWGPDGDQRIEDVRTYRTPPKLPPGIVSAGCYRWRNDSIWCTGYDFNPGYRIPAGLHLEVEVQLRQVPEASTGTLVAAGLALAAVGLSKRRHPR